MGQRIWKVGKIFPKLSYIIECWVTLLHEGVPCCKYRNRRAVACSVRSYWGKREQTRSTQRCFYNARRDLRSWVEIWVLCWTPHLLQERQWRKSWCTIPVTWESFTAVPKDFLVKPSQVEQGHQSTESCHCLLNFVFLCRASIALSLDEPEWAYFENHSLNSKSNEQGLPSVAHVLFSTVWMDSLALLSDLESLQTSKTSGHLLINACCSMLQTFS